MSGCFVNEFFIFISPVVAIAIGIMWDEKVFQISNFTWIGPEAGINWLKQSPVFGYLSLGTVIGERKRILS